MPQVRSELGAQRVRDKDSKGHFLAQVESWIQCESSERTRESGKIFRDWAMCRRPAMNFVWEKAPRSLKKTLGRHTFYA